jgi:uncharacterized membrane protein HdeD (DUF308 family)
MLPPIKVAWGQVGSSVPGKNWLMYEYIVGVLVWLLAGIAAIVKYVRQRRHHKNGSFQPQSVFRRFLPSPEA